jgi:hypothetical protein
MQARTATSPNSSSRHAEREITLSWDKADSLGLRRLRAECDDEVTVWTFSGPQIIDEANIERLLAGEMGTVAIEDHLGRCQACQSWQKGAA